MKVLIATEKPFAAAAVDGIRQETEAAGNELVLLEKYTEKAQLLDAVKAVGQEGGFVYIMETGAGIPYISTTLSTDVTAQVKAKLGL